MASISIPTAVMIAGGTAAAGSVAASVVGSNAASKAAKTQAQSAQSAVALQREMFDTIQQNLNPFMSVGQGAIPFIQGLTGVTGPGASAPGANSPGATSGPLTGQAAAEALGPTAGLFSGKGNSPLQDIQQALIKGLPISDASWAQAGLPPGGGAKLNPVTSSGASALTANPLGSTPFDPTEFLKQTPGYQFTLNQGLQATQNSYASHGLSESGPALKGAANYAEGLAGTTYEARLADYFNLLESGQNAAAGLGGFATSAGLNMGNTAMSGAAATAAGTVGSANAITGGITGASSGLSNIALARALDNSGMFSNPAGFADDSGLGGFPAAYQG